MALRVPHLAVQPSADSMEAGEMKQVSSKKSRLHSIRAINLICVVQSENLTCNFRILRWLYACEFKLKIEGTRGIQFSCQALLLSSEFCFARMVLTF